MSFYVNGFSSDMLYLEHIQGAALVALANHHLAHQTGILSHQHVLELVDLNPPKNPTLSFHLD